MDSGCILNLELIVLSIVWKWEWGTSKRVNVKLEVLIRD